MSRPTFHLLAFLISVGFSLVILSPPQYAGMETVYWMHVSQTFQFESGKLLFEKNFSVFNSIGVVPACSDPFGAGVGLLNVSGLIVVSSYSENHFPCTLDQFVRTWTALKPAAILFPSLFGSFRSWGLSSPFLPIIPIPLLYVGADPVNDAFTVILNGPLQPYQALRGPVTRLYLDYPSQHPFLRLGFYYQSIMVALNVAALTLGLFVMLVSVFQWARLYEIGNSVSIPKLCCYATFLTGFVCWLIYGVMNGNNGSAPSSDYNGRQFFFYFPFGLVLSALILMGFYLKELSVITTSKKVAGLDKLTIPAVILLLLVWGISIGVGLTQATRTPLYDNPQPMYNFIFAMLGVIVPCLALAILAYGSVAILLSSGPDERKRVMRPLLCCTISASLNVAGSLAWNVLWFIQDFATLNMTVITYEFTVDFIAVIFPLLSSFLLLLVFRRVESQEIELSKRSNESTTSSTSHVPSEVMSGIEL
jgi:uncharacterized protein with PQ loop repeat